MNRIITLILFVAVTTIYGFVGKGNQPKEFCQRERARATAKEQLKPFRFTGTKARSFYLKDFHQRKETVIELLFDVPYRVIFDRSGLPEGQDIDIMIYDKPYGKRNRTLIFKDDGGSDKIVFDTQEMEENYPRLFVEYLIYPYEGPELDASYARACITMSHGYMNKRLPTDDDL